MKKSHYLAGVLALILTSALPPATRAAPAPASPAKAGLDALGDDRLMSELAGRGLDKLLDHVFDVNHVPPQQRESIKSLSQLRRLTTDPALIDPRTADKAAEKEAIIDNICNNVDALLPAVSSGEVLMQQARIIYSSGVESMVALIENWGATDATKAKLLPRASAVVKMEQKAFDLEDKIKTDAANSMTGPTTTDPNNPNNIAAKAYDQADQLSGTAMWMKCQAIYALALASEKSDLQRNKAIADALNVLPQWDSSASGIMVAVRMLKARLEIAKGSASDLADARKALASIIAAPDIKGDNPPADADAVFPSPSDGQRFDARFYMVLAALADNDLDTAAKALTAASDFQKKQTPPDRNAALAVELLNYRVLAAVADKADAKNKPAANDAAVTALTTVLKDFPEYKGLILAQLAARMPAHPDLTKLDPMLLDAIRVSAQRETAGKDYKAKVDEVKVQNGIDACRELLRRDAAGEKLPPDSVRAAALYIGELLRHLGKDVEAANALLDFAQKYAKDPKPIGRLTGPNAAMDTEAALDNAGVIIDELSHTAAPVSPPGSDDVIHLQDRFLSIAVDPPFGRKELALQWAGRLYAAKDWLKAIRYYRMVPESAKPGVQLSARYFEMLSIRNYVDDTPAMPSAERAAHVQEIQQLADKVNIVANAMLKDPATTDTEKKRARTSLAQTLIVAAGLARSDLKDPKRALQLLNGFEDSIQGLPNETALLSDALFLRVQSYMMLQQNRDATDTLVQYLKTAKGDEGPYAVQELLKNLNKDLARAQARANAARRANDAADLTAASADIQQIAESRAVLSNFLVSFIADRAKAETDPKGPDHLLAYTYSRFAADAKSLAASLSPDADARRKGLDESLALFRQLQSPDNVAIYRLITEEHNRKTGSKTDATAPDPLVTLGIGEISFELGDYVTARDMLGGLLRDGTLGDNNDQYWGAMYQLLRSLHELAKKGVAGPSEAEIQQSLRSLYAQWQDDIGGLIWHDKFDELRKEVLPGWTPPSTPSAATKPS